jgi:hypothetical protein
MLCISIVKNTTEQNRESRAFLPVPAFKMPNRHRPGYISPSNKALRNYRVQLRPETIAAWKEAAARAGMSQRQATEHLFCTFAREHGVDVPSPPQRTNSRIKPLTRLIVPPLDC